MNEKVIREEERDGQDSSIKKLDDYLRKLDAYQDKSVIFRGIDSPLKMLPTIVRSFCRNQTIIENEGRFQIHQYERRCVEWLNGRYAHADKKRGEFQRYETELFKSFKRQARMYLQHYPQNNWEWIALAQHHKLPTRLLDWSKNPLAGLFFAVSGDSSITQDTFVCVLNFGDLMDTGDMIDLDNPLPDDPFEVSEKSGLRRFIPPIIDIRMSVQESVFTILDPFVPLKIAAPDRLQQFVIDGNSRSKILKELQRCGVNKSSLFRDLSNLAEHLKWVWEEYRNG
jgi:hypothetical protein